MTLKDTLLKRIRSKTTSFYNNHHLFFALLKGENLFPWRVPVKLFSSSEISKNYSQVKNEIDEVYEASKNKIGCGPLLEYEVVKSRIYGEQKVPSRVIFESEDDFIHFIKKEKHWKEIKKIYSRQQEYTSFDLKTLLLKSPRLLLDNLHLWPKLLAVASYLYHYPRPMLYIRQLGIEGVDTKFIEKNKRALHFILDFILPSESIDQGFSYQSSRGFENRYGLLYDSPRVRLRILDQNIAQKFGHLSDIEIPIQDLRELDIPCQKIFITENKVNGLVFPAIDKSIVIFGLGLGVTILKECHWMSKLPIYYWGDIDVFGFAILAQLRECFPHVESLLMSEEVLVKYSHLLVELKGAKMPSLKLNRQYLTVLEQELYSNLINGLWGKMPSLEQERIPLDELNNALDESILP